MGQKKLIRFAEIKSFSNVLEYPAGIKGKWNDFFKNTSPIILELACGKGEYAIGLSRLYPQRNFIGIDIKGNRIWRGAKTALEEGLSNVAFVRSQIDKVTDYFSKDEVAEIWITFPDPQLRLSRMKKRLTHPRFLRLYQQFLQHNGLVHLKTDSPVLYNFTKTVINLYDLELLDDYDDVYRQTTPGKELSIKTHYEGLDIAGSNRIHYLQFRLNKIIDPLKDKILKNMIGEQQID
ncbi:tRNA (guanosine(46)-N7)-methyltransferase TrmB [Panacibacter ginsenosidivorans]|uniref:tRNA (guanine(46)-N(7))-methyltransferase n=1 Tax=Panacibacter ginsenosidivorans TaxID=1813871 RepID=A0A5B8VA38_9BACT|nr:tRNA (guanosine(46)-N7)-methyltransferase TrmB [Panacibacter ginsenosidivorans]QEC68139.1 tRNA (guanosine(46)-N7)-methyltransferase TrmB [Panacibacter ginsenosidivorans]